MLGVGGVQNAKEAAPQQESVVEETSLSAEVQTADELLCSGTITGDITVKCGLALEHTARIYGNISAATISMSRGAIIKGTVTTEQN